MLVDLKLFLLLALLLQDPLLLLFGGLLLLGFLPEHLEMERLFLDLPGFPVRENVYPPHFVVQERVLLLAHDLHTLREGLDVDALDGDGVLLHDGPQFAALPRLVLQVVDLPFLGFRRTLLLRLLLVLGLHVGVKVPEVVVELVGVELDVVYQVADGLPLLLVVLVVGFEYLFRD